MRTMQEIEDDINLLQDKLSRLNEERTKIGYKIQNQTLQEVFDQIPIGAYLRIGNVSYSQFLKVGSKKINFKNSNWNGSIEIEPDDSFPAFSIAAHDDGYVSCNESEQTVYIQMNSENEIGQWSIITPEEFNKFYAGFGAIGALAKIVLGNV